MFADQQLIATVERGELWTDGLLNVVPSPVLSVKHLTNNIVGRILRLLLRARLRSRHLLHDRPQWPVAGRGVCLQPSNMGSAAALFDFIIAHGCVELVVHRHRGRGPARCWVRR